MKFYDPKYKQLDLGLLRSSLDENDSLLGRTTTLDPKAEKYYSFSPYTWCVGNPVKFVDPSGEVYGIIYDEDQRQIIIKANVIN